MNHYPALNFSIFRISIGLYLTIHFITVFHYSPDIWSHQGTLAHAELNFTWGHFPNILNSFDSPPQIQIFIMGLTILSILLTLGWQRPCLSILLWYGWACLFHRNNFISNPGLPMVGWLLLALAVIPKGEPWSWREKHNPHWKMPKLLFYGAWGIIGLSYTLSGIDKLSSQSWIDGTAIIHLLNNPLARDTLLRELLLSLPSFIHQGMTWSVLALEIMFGPLCLFSRTRKWAWIAIIMMHIGILSTVQFADLTFGVLMFHLFTMEPTWFQKHRQHPLIVFYDGTCGFCQSSVQFIMDLDPNAQINFSPLQGARAQNQIPSEILQKLDSIVVLDGEHLSTKSDAILHIGKRLGGWGVFIQIGYVFPRVFRNQLYDLIAKHRYLIMGKSEQCRIPSEKDLKRFIP